MEGSAVRGMLVCCLDMVIFGPSEYQILTQSMLGQMLRRERMQITGITIMI